MLTAVPAPPMLSVVAVVLTRSKEELGVVNDVVIAGLVLNTKVPVPVSSVTAPNKLALDGVAKNVATPVPRPLIPVATGNPVALVNVTADGVPKLGVVSTGLVENTRLPVPVSSVTTVARLAAVGVARNVATPVPSPEIPELTGKPVALVSTAYDGVPMLGVNKTGLEENTNEPEPVSSVTALARLELVGVAKNVATPVPKPLIPVATGRPVALVNVTD